ncbi:unnamed protein product [Effrenium voratum]|nr:unnamed protein product [Effrenium voratum]
MLEHPEIELETGLGPSGEEPEGGLRKRPELVLGDLFECWHKPVAKAEPILGKIQERRSKAALPEPWTRRLANTMILHTVQNSMILATYLLDLLTGGYGARSALHIACWEGSLSAVQAVANGSKQAVQEWHKRKGDLTPLHIAAICSFPEVAELLLGYDVDPNINTVHQLRSLHIAATSSSEVCEVLLAGKADFAARSADQDTPLHFANCFQQIDSVELLLKAGLSLVTIPIAHDIGADATASNNFGVVPLHAS